MIMLKHYQLLWLIMFNIILPKSSTWSVTRTEGLKSYLTYFIFKGVFTIYFCSLAVRCLLLTALFNKSSCISLSLIASATSLPTSNTLIFFRLPSGKKFSPLSKYQWVLYTCLYHFKHRRSKRSTVISLGFCLCGFLDKITDITLLNSSALL